MAVHDEEPDGTSQDPEFMARRARLNERLDAARARQTPPPSALQPKGGLSGMAAGLKIASEFIAGIVVGALIGYGIDVAFDTRPFGLIVFLLFGFAAGVTNVVRSVSKDKKSPDSGQQDPLDRP
ncbi:AtpZ/AtpI family protein [Aureimonas altamirensis]|uniref:AtpZ/AtpI family protein n=1 Tax=Aureimonas altamirensis TaxID=370622 RepID=UPI001E30EB72|nr:AtpZ/AtpI family protein [Aureimonas altamirensis]UHD47303.1 AtpZ/AtpI family protein [Aureimonas altamirensis]